MNTMDLLKMKWKPVEDLSRLTATIELEEKRYGIGLRDVKRFYNEIIEETANKLGVSEEDVRQYMNFVNADFMNCISEFFRYQLYAGDNDELAQMLRRIMVPTKEYDSEDIAQIFKLLPEEEKAKFLDAVTVA